MADYIQAEPNETKKDSNRCVPVDEQRCVRAIVGFDSRNRSVRSMDDGVADGVEREVAKLRMNYYVQVGKAYYQPVYGSFRQLASDHCIYVYEGTGGEKIILADYVHDIICATNAPEVRERFFAHLNKTWKITDEGTLDRFAGVHFERSEAKRTWKASVGGYIDRVAQRLDVLDAKLADTPNGS